MIVLACQKTLLEGKIPDQELGEDRHFDDAMIASLTGATASLVKKIRAELNEENKG